MTAASNTQKPDIAHWLTQTEAAAILKISPKHLDRFCKDPVYPLPKAYARLIPGKRSSPVYDPAWIEWQRKERESIKAEVMSPAEVARMDKREQRAQKNMAVQLAVAGTRILKSPLPIERRYFLTIEEAAAYFSMSMAKIEQLCKSAAVHAEKTPRWMINRADLELWILAQCKNRSMEVSHAPQGVPQL